MELDERLDRRSSPLLETQFNLEHVSFTSKHFKPALQSFPPNNTQTIEMSEKKPPIANLILVLNIEIKEHRTTTQILDMNLPPLHTSPPTSMAVSLSGDSLGAAKTQKKNTTPLDPE